MLITTNFANAAKFRGNKYSIARNQPKGCRFITLKDLQPTQKMMSEYKSGRISWDQYTEQYIRILDGSKWLLTKIAEMAKEDDVILICYEKVLDNCHRTLIAEYLIQNFDFPENLWKKC